MNKKIIWSAVAVVVLIVAGLFTYSAISKQNSQKAVNDYLSTNSTPTPTGTNAEPTGTASGKDAKTYSGSVALTSQNTKMAWIGRKTIVAGYEDAGSIDLSSGTVSMVEGKVTEVQAVIDMKSLKTLSTGKGEGQDMLTKHLSSADFFDVEKYPTSELKITSAKIASEANGVQTYDFSGTLTMKGITQPVNFSGNVTLNGSSAKMESEMKLDRTKWGINYGSSKLADSFIDDMFTLKVVANAEVK